ncbi:MAG: hypothetical protein KAT68_15600 [Bacteroidales bacterium]|nr:hypothetical protein [Bacteroidales bacterium]
MKRNFLIFIIIILIGCGKDELPKKTQEGENTFGMLVDGIEWIPDNPGIFSHGNSKPFSVYYTDYSTLEISAEGKGYIYLTTEIKDTGNYFLNTLFFKIIPDSLQNNDSIFFEYQTRFIKGSNEYDPYFLKDSLNSNINITKFDTVNQIVSGTFNITLFNKTNEKLEITEGRFDINYNTL